MICPDYLMHFGVKGMHWGVRKDRGSSGSGRRALTPEQRAERTRKIRKAGRIALQTAGAAYLARGIIRGHKAGQRYTEAVNRTYGPAMAKYARTGARIGTGLVAAGTIGGAAALHRSEKLRQASMRERDKKKAQKLRASSRRWAVGGGLAGSKLAAGTYALYRHADKERRRRDPEKYRAMGYYRN